MQPASEPTIRVVMLIDQFWPIVGGAEQQALRLGREMVRRGVSVAVLTRRVRSNLATFEAYAGVQIHRLPPTGTTHRHRLGSAGWAVAWLVRHAASYDLVHCHGCNPLEWTAALAQLGTRKPYIVKLTRVGFLDFARGGGEASSEPARHIPARPVLASGIRTVRRRILQRAAAVVATNAEIEARLRDAGVGRIARIPNGVDTQVFAPADHARKRALRTQLGLPAEALVFVYAGRLAPVKNIETLLHGWQRASACDNGSRLLLLGDCEPGGEAYRAALERQGGNVAGIEFKGPVDKVVEYLQAADVAVLPSWREGMSNVLLEAMACGLPILCSRIAGNRDVAREGIDALGFDPADQAELAEQIVRLDRDAMLRARLGASGRERAVAQFSLQSVGRATQELYGRICGA